MPHDTSNATQRNLITEKGQHSALDSSPRFRPGRSSPDEAFFGVLSIVTKLLKHAAESSISSIFSQAKVAAFGASMPVIRFAFADDLDGLLCCARVFHAEDGHPLPQAGERALAALLDANSPYGRVLILEVEGKVAGYAVLCFGYSVEFGGRDAFIDDLYVAPEWRGKSLGDRLMRALEESARESGCHALHLEVFTGNPMASWYKSLGFDSRGSLMSKRFG